MTLNEKETRLQLVAPKLAASGWNSGLVDEEYMYRPGKLRLLGDQTVRDEPQFVDYVLRAEPRGGILAVVEAKDESHTPGAGLQQGLAYAIDVGAPFAFATNGHSIVEQDMRTGQVRELAEFPTPAELKKRFETGSGWRGSMVMGRDGKTVPNPLLRPAFALPGAPAMRYYQERAVSAALEQILAGNRRALLSLATGTGKTFIAFNIVYKLLATGYAKRVLFIADRVTLRDQAYNEFGGLGDRRAVVSGPELPLARDVHFAIYQSLYADAPGGGKVYERYPRDYFDVVIIDECHRSGYGDWGAILEYFSGAFHLGMTATPKQDDSVDTYAYFASENKDEQGVPRPVYEYSLGRGIDDGYLATYKVIKVATSIDDGLVIEDEVERGAELIVPEGTTPRDIYEMREFERGIVVPDRTKLLCEHLAGILRTYGALDKTIVFCVTMEHAELVRNEMQNLLGSETGKNLYAARIVSEERDAEALLQQFQLSSSSEPVVVTTVDLLSTGVNVPSVRNIVFMRPIGSVTMFKQIIGRGSRVDSITGKTYFRIVDYTNATRLFDQWDLPTAPPADGPIEGDKSIAGIVTDGETGELLADASISVRLTGRLLAETRTAEDGSFRIEALPTTVVDLFVTSAGYTRRHLRVDTDQAEATELDVALRKPSQADERIRITGVDVAISEELELDLGNGNIIQGDEYLERAKATIVERVGSLSELRQVWIDKAKRAELADYLGVRQVTPELLALVLGRADIDGFDLIASAAFDLEPLSFSARATAAEPLLDAEFPWLPEGFITAVLDKFRLGGVGEIASSELFGLTPFVTQWGGVLGVASLLGGPEEVTRFLNAIPRALFESEGNA
ncbi:MULTISPECIES: DEAD/DEAH box helicase family protein [Mycobacteroides]|uniref:DEAD/DEAH box helicase family protein n=1 Tax=Mycobacteroides TaxID=670516 RepID=UPI0009A5B053|nr:DEAD/DEAH box helicase family protein [Mycobacteroides abscessus]AWG70732.1 restriction endonuclease subunit R [Mycobacteroides abscessus]PVB05525.1 restriction endonuclease subunit R [Mycobacteroides abscessus]PVB30187.1 restriction endonuclease subunit R [Mycobacteroides abscessus]SKK72046.1 type I restriction-modification system, R subunit [Mycobacteroides abscessus subsp. massiliense]SKL19309.1 type I restriction-modification system, R subunit [Mycobacteroides abscessus subsp. massilien